MDIGDVFMERFIREKMIIGDDAFYKINNSHIAVFGIGGVGSYVCEALARAGVGELTLVDNDIVSKSNINRQLVALSSTIGQYKTTVMKHRINDINPYISVNEIKKFYLPENESDFPLDNYDYVIDCIDTVSAKLSLAERCTKSNIKIISSMGTGNKIHGEMLEIDDLYNTSVCPLARVMRRECNKRNIKKLKVLYSKEEPITPFQMTTTELKNNRIAPGSISFVPSVAGLLIAGEVIRDLIY